MIRCALFGNPVNHSLSPLVHSLFAREAKIELKYETIVTTPDNFFILLKEFAERGGIGAKCNQPFKTKCTSTL